jgi:hypothetical protein
MSRITLTALLILAAVLAGAPAAAQKQAGHEHGTVQAGPETADVQKAVAALREATARFHRIDVAIQEGYAPFGPCFSDPSGGMGFHYANAELMEDPGVDPLHPELLLYEKQPDGSMKFVGVEYLTFQAAWHEAGNRALPRLFGQRFHLNTTLLDEPFYLLHVWQWKHNPAGRFTDWNPRVTCR